MVDKNLLFKIQAEDAGVEKTFGQISKAAAREMGKVEDSLDESLTAGQRVAIGLGKMADDIERELGDAQRAAQRLGEELGPELRAKLGKGGVDNLIRDLQRAGLEFSDIEADAKDLADAVKRLDRVSAKVEVEADAEDAKADLDRVEDGLRQLDGDTAKVNIDVGGAEALSDAIGRIPGPLGDITGALGPGGTIAGGALAIGGSILAAAGHAANLAIEAKTTADLVGSTVEDASRLQSVWKTSGADVNDLNDVLLQMNGVLLDSPEMAKQLGINLNDGKDVAARFVEVVEKIEKAGLGAADKAKLMSAAFGEEGVRQVQTLLTLIGGDLQGALDGVSETQVFDEGDVEKALELKRQVTELTTALQNFAVMIGQVVIPAVQAIGGGWETVRDNFAALEEDIGEAFRGLPWVESRSEKDMRAFWTSVVEASAPATEEMGRFARVMNGETVPAIQAAEDAISPYLEHQAGMVAAQEDLAEQAEAAAAALLEEADALDAAREAMRNAADASIAAADAQDKFVDAAEETVRVQGDAEATADDLRDAVKSERDAMIDAADAAVRLAEETAAASGNALSATGKVDAFNGSLLNNARYATPAARDAIADYIIQANNIPATKSTAIKAAIARGDFATAEQLINETSRSRTAAIKADAITGQAENDLNKLARNRTTRINVITSGGSSIRGIDAASAGGGTTYTPGGETTLVGENGPEVVRLPTGSHVYRNGESRAMGMGAGSAVPNITINNNGRDLSSADIVRVIRTLRVTPG